MRKIQVIRQKEMIREDELVDSTAIVIDVFLATSTIGFLLEKNYEPIYATKSIGDAEDLANTFIKRPFMLGELYANPVAGFTYPDSSLIKQAQGQEVAIISSTNGTVAIEAARSAGNLYLSSLINGHILAKELENNNDESPIIIICSGNAGGFSLEDFVGAGQIIHYLIQENNYDLSESAILALDRFKQSQANDYKDLLESRTAQLLANKGFPNAIHYVLENVEKISVLPVYEDGKIVNKLR